MAPGKASGQVHLQHFTRSVPCLVMTQFVPPVGSSRFVSVDFSTGGLAVSGELQFSGERL